LLKINKLAVRDEDECCEAASSSAEDEVTTEQRVRAEVVVPDDYSAEKRAKLVMDKIFFYGAVNMCSLCSTIVFAVCPQHNTIMSRVVHPKLGVYRCIIPECTSHTLDMKCLDECCSEYFHTLMCVFSIEQAAILRRLSDFTDTGIFARCADCFSTSLHFITEECFTKMDMIVVSPPHAKNPAILLSEKADVVLREGFPKTTKIEIALDHCIEDCKGVIQISPVEVDLHSLCIWTESFKNVDLSEASRCD
jgi:hypothetical protein